MRILQIIPSISLVYGGPSQMIRDLSRTLAEQGAEVTVLTTNSNGDTGQPPLDVPLGQPIPQDGYTIRYFSCSPFRRYKFSLGLLIWLARHGRAYDVAHIHALFSPVSTAAATVARLQGLPYLLRPLGTLDPADLRKKAKLKRLYGRFLEAPNLAGAAAVHFTSPLEAQVSERFGAKTRDRVIPLGVPGLAPGQQSDRATAKAQVQRRWALPIDRPLLLFLSRLDPKKGLDLLLPSLETLKKAGFNFHFVLAGANPQDPGYEALIQQRIQRSVLASCTTITGFVTGADKWTLLQAADLFMLPSFYENFGIAVAEAMIAGTPVLVSEGVYIWPDIQAGEAGWVVPCTEEALTAQLRSLLQTPKILIPAGANARAYAQTQYAWPAIGQKLLQTYREVSQNPKISR